MIKFNVLDNGINTLASFHKDIVSSSKVCEFVRDNNEKFVKNDEFIKRMISSLKER